MGVDKPGWYYVGDDQFRYMDADGWTDQYRPRDGAVKPDVKPATSPSVPGPVTEKTVDSNNNASSLAGRCVAVATGLITAVWHFIAAGYQGTSASLSRRALAKNGQLDQSASGAPEKGRLPGDWFLTHLLPIALIPLIISGIFISWQDSQNLRLRAGVEYADHIVSITGGDTHCGWRSGSTGVTSGLTDEECQARFEASQAEARAVVGRGEALISWAQLVSFASLAILVLWTWRRFRQCPYCFKRVSGKASICRYCGKAVVPTRR